METGVLYLFHAMLVLAELIVCWPTVMSLSLTCGSPEASGNKRAVTYFGRLSASLLNKFWTKVFW